MSGSGTDSIAGQLRQLFSTANFDDVAEMKRATCLYRAALLAMTQGTQRLTPEAVSDLSQALTQALAEVLKRVPLPVPVPAPLPVPVPAPLTPKTVAIQFARLLKKVPLVYKIGDGKDAKGSGNNRTQVSRLKKVTPDEMRKYVDTLVNSFTATGLSSADEDVMVSQIFQSLETTLSRSIWRTQILATFLVAFDKMWKTHLVARVCDVLTDCKWIIAGKPEIVYTIKTPSNPGIDGVRNYMLVMLAGDLEKTAKSYKGTFNDIVWHEWPKDQMFDLISGLYGLALNGSLPDLLEFSLDRDNTCVLMEQLANIRDDKSGRKRLSPLSALAETLLCTIRQGAKYPQGIFTYAVTDPLDVPPVGGPVADWITALERERKAEFCVSKRPQQRGSAS